MSAGRQLLDWAELPVYYKKQVALPKRIALPLAPWNIYAG